LELGTPPVLDARLPLQSTIRLLDHIFVLHRLTRRDLMIRTPQREDRLVCVQRHGEVRVPKAKLVRASDNANAVPKFLLEARHKSKGSGFDFGVSEPALAWSMGDWEEAKHLVSGIRPTKSGDTVGWAWKVVFGNRHFNPPPTSYPQPKTPYSPLGP
jgi:hypothetical protein